MLCEKCHVKEATYHSTININGNVTETHLCSACAISEHKTNNIFNVGSFFANPDLLVKEAFVNKNTYKCNFCETTYEDFLETGLLGCPNCYNAFMDKLIPIIKNIHPDIKHIGKKPLDAIDDNKNDVAQNIRNLEYKLKQAVALENYELASKLKKQINELKAGGLQND